jgi:hypothetical protein
MRERNDKPRGAVRLSVIGRLWREDSLANSMIRGFCFLVNLGIFQANQLKLGRDVLGALG